MAQTMKRFNSNKVRMLGNLIPLTEKQKARLRAERGVKQSLGSAFVNNGVVSDYHEVKAVRDYLAPVKADYKPGRKRRGVSGCQLSPEKRAMVMLRRGQRVAFFASLGVKA